MPPKKASGSSRGNSKKPLKENAPAEASSSSGSQRGTLARKRVLALKNDSESEVEEAQEETQTPAKTSKKPVAKKKAKATPEKKKNKAQDTKDQKKQKYLDKVANLNHQGRKENIDENSNQRHSNSINICHIVNNFKSGRIKQAAYTNRIKDPVVQNISQFKVWRCRTPFDRRVTALAWHPTKPGLACVGSKGGDLLLWDIQQEMYSDIPCVEEYAGRIEGKGPGGSIQSLKFDEISPNRVYIASIDGTVALKDFQGNAEQVFLNTHDWDKWYTGLDVDFVGKTMVAGRNNGCVTLLSLDGQEIWTHKLHKNKCNFVQYNTREPWMFVTSSVEGVVKVWDIRNIKDKSSALNELVHDKPVNSAYFSGVSGDKLLTTDQHSQLRIYQGPFWHLSQTIAHPHRQFQHLTPIKGCWHPLVDIPFAGRYPDPQFPGNQVGELRSIDFFSTDTGDTVLQLHQPGIDKIISLSQFNPSGDFLLSGMASSVLVWKQGPPQEEEDDEQGGSRRPASSSSGAGPNHWPEFSAKAKKPREKKKKE